MEKGLNPKLGNMILRVVIGVVFMAHGAPKLFGGVGSTGEMLAGLGIPFPGLFAWAVTLLEFFGGLALIVGLLVAPVAVLLCVHMLMGIVLVHAANGFFVIDYGTGGVELNLVLIAGLLALLLGGPGLAALDARGEGAAAGGPEYGAAERGGAGTGGAGAAGGDVS